MMISTKGRYALRLMVDLAEHGGEDFIPLKEAAERQNISQKYMESIMTLLSKNGMVEGMHGKGGGYRLNRSPEDYCVGEILRITEGTLAPVACLEQGALPCGHAGQCRTLPMWKGLESLISSYLDGITIASLMRREGEESGM